MRYILKNYSVMSGSTEILRLVLKIICLAVPVLFRLNTRVPVSKI